MAARMRVCWPYPGTWCLVGTCRYCRSAGFVQLSAVKAYAKTVQLRKALKYAQDRGFPNHAYRA